MIYFVGDHHGHAFFPATEELQALGVGQIVQFCQEEEKKKLNSHVDVVSRLINLASEKTVKDTLNNSINCDDNSDINTVSGRNDVSALINSKGVDAGIVIVLFPFVHDLTRRVHDPTTSTKEGLLKAIRNVDVSSLSQMIVLTTRKWNVALPGAKVVWTLPAKIDFLKCNESFVHLNKQDFLSEREVRGCLESTEIFCCNLDKLKTSLVYHPDINLINLDDIIESALDNSTELGSVKVAEMLRSGLFPEEEACSFIQKQFSIELQAKISLEKIDRSVQDPSQPDTTEERRFSSSTCANKEQVDFEMANGEHNQRLYSLCITKVQVANKLHDPHSEQQCKKTLGIVRNVNQDKLCMISHFTEDELSNNDDLVGTAGVDPANVELHSVDVIEDSNESLNKSPLNEEPGAITQMVDPVVVPDKLASKASVIVLNNFEELFTEMDKVGTRKEVSSELDIVIPRIEKDLICTDVVSETSEVASETAEVASETAEVASETAEVASEAAEVSPETAEVSPEPAEVTPETTEVAPETAEVAPETAEVAPVMAEVAPVMAEVAPVMSEDAPVMAEIAPEMAEVAEEVEDAPETGAAASNAGTVDSETTAVASEIVKVAPKTVEVAPKTEEVAPKTEEVPPKLAEIALGTVEFSPGTVEAAPEAAEVTLEATENAPEGAEIASQAAEVAPEAAIVAPETAIVAPESAKVVLETAKRPLLLERIKESSVQRNYEMDVSMLQDFVEATPSSTKHSSPTLELEGNNIEELQFHVLDAEGYSEFEHCSGKGDSDETTSDVEIIHCEDDPEQGTDQNENQNYDSTTPNDGGNDDDEAFDYDDVDVDYDNRYQGVVLSDDERHCSWVNDIPPVIDIGDDDEEGIHEELVADAVFCAADTAINTDTIINSGGNTAVANVSGPEPESIDHNVTSVIVDDNNEITTTGIFFSGETIIAATPLITPTSDVTCNSPTVIIATDASGKGSPDAAPLTIIPSGGDKNATEKIMAFQLDTCKNNQAAVHDYRDWACQDEELIYEDVAEPSDENTLTSLEKEQEGEAEAQGTASTDESHAATNLEEGKNCTENTQTIINLQEEGVAGTENSPTATNKEKGKDTSVWVTSGQKYLQKAVNLDGEAGGVQTATSTENSQTIASKKKLNNGAAQSVPDCHILVDLSSDDETEDEPLPSSMERDNAQFIAQFCKHQPAAHFELKKKGIIFLGLQYIAEVHRDGDPEEQDSSRNYPGCYSKKKKKGKLTKATVIRYVCLLCNKQMVSMNTLIAHGNSMPHKISFARVHVPELAARLDNVPSTQWTAGLLSNFRQMLDKVARPLVAGRRMSVCTKTEFLSVVANAIKDNIGDLAAFPVFAADKERYPEEDLLNSLLGREGVEAEAEAGVAVDAAAVTANRHPTLRGTAAEGRAPSSTSKSRDVGAVELASCTALILRNMLAKNLTTSTASFTPSKTQNAVVSRDAKASKGDRSTKNIPPSSEETGVGERSVEGGPGDAVSTAAVCVIDSTEAPSDVALDASADGGVASNGKSGDQAVTAKSNTTSEPFKGTTVADSFDVTSTQSSTKAADNTSGVTNADSAAETAWKWTGATRAGRGVPKVVELPVRLLIVGDDRIASWTDIDVHDTTVCKVVHCEPYTHLPQLVALADKHLSAEDRVLVLVISEKELIFEKGVNNILYVTTEKELAASLAPIRTTLARWKTKFPSLTVVWTMPCAVDVKEVNIARLDKPTALLTNVENYFVQRTCPTLTRRYKQRLQQIRETLYQNAAHYIDFSKDKVDIVVQKDLEPTLESHHVMYSLVKDFIETLILQKPTAVTGPSKSGRARTLAGQDTTRSEMLLPTNAAEGSDVECILLDDDDDDDDTSTRMDEATSVRPSSKRVWSRLGATSPSISDNDNSEDDDTGNWKRRRLSSSSSRPPGATVASTTRPLHRRSDINNSSSHTVNSSSHTVNSSSRDESLPRYEPPSARHRFVNNPTSSRRSRSPSPGKKRRRSSSGKARSVSPPKASSCRHESRSPSPRRARHSAAQHKEPLTEDRPNQEAVDDELDKWTDLYRRQVSSMTTVFKLADLLPNKEASSATKRPPTSSVNKPPSPRSDNSRKRATRFEMSSGTVPLSQRAPGGEVTQRSFPPSGGPCVVGNRFPSNGRPCVKGNRHFNEAESHANTQVKRTSFDCVPPTSQCVTSSSYGLASNPTAALQHSYFDASASNSLRPPASYHSLPGMSHSSQSSAAGPLTPRYDIVSTLKDLTDLRELSNVSYAITSLLVVAVRDKMMNSRPMQMFRDPDNIVATKTIYDKMKSLATTGAGRASWTLAMNRSYSAFSWLLDEIKQNVFFGIDGLAMATETYGLSDTLVLKVLIDTLASSGVPTNSMNQVRNTLMAVIRTTHSQRRKEETGRPTAPPPPVLSRDNPSWASTSHSFDVDRDTAYYGYVSAPTSTNRISACGGLSNLPTNPIRGPSTQPNRSIPPPPTYSNNDPLRPGNNKNYFFDTPGSSSQRSQPPAVSSSRYGLQQSHYGHASRPPVQQQPQEPVRFTMHGRSDPNRGSGSCYTTTQPLAVTQAVDDCRDLAEHEFTEDIPRRLHHTRNVSADRPCLTDLLEEIIHQLAP